MVKKLCKNLLSNGGIITPLLIPAENTGGTGLMNPSIFNDEGNLILNIRHVNYTLYHCENGQLFNNRYGPLAYLNPENDIKLRTWNYFCTLKNDFSVKNYFKVDTSKHDIEPVWEFIGLEDARLFKWDGKYYYCGVRRDVKPNGEGRMEMSELKITHDFVQEVKRSRIQPPIESHLEKNWMPVLDMPFHFVKWTNPTEVVKVDLKTCSSKTVYLSHDKINDIGDLRGGSQVITVGDYRMCIVHEVALWKNTLQQKDAKYTHRFVVWDKSWNIIKVSDAFSFMDGEIEFCCGMTTIEDDILITFGFQDNAAFVIRGSFSFFEEFIGIKLETHKNKKPDGVGQITVVNYSKNKGRVKAIFQQGLEYGFRYIDLSTTTPDIDRKTIIKGKYAQATIDIYGETTLKGAVSHIRAIERWYNKFNTPYALIVEDDIDLSTIQYWNFTWNQFIHSLPADWDCVQLGVISENINDFKLRRRTGDRWSCMAYIITRDHAKRLIDLYHKGEEYLLEIPESDIQPHVENLIYLSGVTYSIPLFIENINLQSSIKDRPEYEKHHKLHQYSHDVVLNWWLETGRNIDLEHLML